MSFVLLVWSQTSGWREGGGGGGGGGRSQTDIFTVTVAVSRQHTQRPIHTDGAQLCLAPGKC